MWKRPIFSLASTAAVSCRRSASSHSSMQKKALKALGTKPMDQTQQSQQPQHQQQQLHQSPTTTSPTPEEINGDRDKEEMVQFLKSPTYSQSGSSVPDEWAPLVSTNASAKTDERLSRISPISPTPQLMHGSAVGQLHEFAPRILVAGVGGGGSNAVNHMVSKGLQGVDFLALNTDAQHLSSTLTDRRLQLGEELTGGLGCGANPDTGRLAAEECRDKISAALENTHMLFITAGMGGGTGTGAAPVVAEIAYQMGILTVAVVTLPFTFEGTLRRRLALEGIQQLQEVVDTLIVIPNQNLFALATPETSFVEAFSMADDVLLGGVKSITDLMSSPGLINLDFADVQSVMHGMGNALLGTGVASGTDRALEAAQLALDNPLLGSDLDISTAKGMLVNITGGSDMTLFEVDKAAQYVTQRVNDQNATIIFGSAYDPALQGSIRVSVVATGIDEAGYMLR